MNFTVKPKGNADQRRAYETKVSINCEKGDCIRCSCPSVCAHECHKVEEQTPAPFGTISLLKRAEHIEVLRALVK